MMGLPSNTRSMARARLQSCFSTRGAMRPARGMILSRVRGTPGQMTVQQAGCRTLPAAETRRHIVDIAVQEWAFFGFSIVEPGGEDFDIIDERHSLDSQQVAVRGAASIPGSWAS